MIKFKAKRSIYISEAEQLELIDALTPTEFKLYTLLLFSLSKSWTPKDYQYDALAKVMRLSSKTVQNTYYSLRKKEYAELAFFKDEQGEQCVKVVLGKDMVKLYRAGIAVSMADSPQLTEALKEYPLDTPNLTQDEVNARIAAINKKLLTVTTSQNNFAVHATPTQP